MSQKQLTKFLRSSYRKLAQVISTDHDQAQLAWMRVHALFQAHQAVFREPCSLEQLERYWQGDTTVLTAHAPAWPHVFRPFSLRQPLPLPRDVLHPLFLLYQDTTTPPPTLSHLYSTIQTADEQKRKGQIFTPPPTVRHAFSLLRHPPQGKLLDLACGTGEYLLTAYDHFFHTCREKGLCPEQTHAQILRHHLHGFDSDPLAVAITHLRLFLRCPTSSALAPHIHTLNATDLFHHPLGHQRYHTIVANPPWGSRLTSEEKQQFKQHFHARTADRMHRVNSFLYFLEATVRLLAEDGTYSLLLPAAFLNLHTYHPMRRYLLEHTELDNLQYAPRLFRKQLAPAVFLSGIRKKVPCDRHHVRLPAPLLQAGEDLDCEATSQPPSEPPRLAPQQSFLQDPQCVLNIHYDPILESLWQRLQQTCLFLREEEGRVQYVLGIVTGHNKRHLYDRPPDGAAEPVLCADDLHPFQPPRPRRFLHYDRSALQQAAPYHLYKAPEKLLYSFFSPSLVCAIDRAGHLTLNSVNLLLPRNLPFSLRYLLGLLNSRLLNTLYAYRFFTRKVLAQNLAQLPIHQPTPLEAARIERLVSHLETTPGPRDFHRLHEAVDHLYRLTPLESQKLTELHQRLQQLPSV
ncbi:MAG TPA: N-6 DNA methylase [Bacilli bacterium]|nr:N-6 DNA methylase [Bacilli bacterium]